MQSYLSFFIDTPQNVRIDNDKEIHHVGEEIQCLAEALPAASFLWRNDSCPVNTTNPEDEICGQIIADDAILTITEELMGYNSVKCVAYNEIRGEIKEKYLPIDLMVTGK